MRLKVIMEDEAKFALRNICSYIELNSQLQANSLKKNVLNSIRELVKNPQKYPPDKFKKQNDGSVRAYELHHLRITYSVSKTHITILRIRHTKRNPPAL
jgi:plasmid stabilization system protein ParE